MADFVFVGERRSALAQRMNVTWYDGRLAAATLHDALRACGVDPFSQRYMNVYTDNGYIDFTSLGDIRSLSREDFVVIGMGTIAQKILTIAEISFRPMVHPAARGSIRRKNVYQSHVRQTLFPLPPSDCSK